MHLKPNMKRIEEALGKVHAADRIEEVPWLDTVMRELSAVSSDFADEL